MVTRIRCRCPAFGLYALPVACVVYRCLHITRGCLCRTRLLPVCCWLPCYGFYGCALRLQLRFARFPVGCSRLRSTRGYTRSYRYTHVHVGITPVYYVPQLRSATTRFTTWVTGLPHYAFTHTCAVYAHTLPYTAPVVRSAYVGSTLHTFACRTARFTLHTRFTPVRGYTLRALRSRTLRRLPALYTAAVTTVTLPALPHILCGYFGSAVFCPLPPHTILPAILRSPLPRSPLLPAIRSPVLVLVVPHATGSTFHCRSRSFTVVTHLWLHVVVARTPPHTAAVTTHYYTPRGYARIWLLRCLPVPRLRTPFSNLQLLYLAVLRFTGSGSVRAAPFTAFCRLDYTHCGWLLVLRSRFTRSVAGLDYWFTVTPFTRLPVRAGYTAYVPRYVPVTFVHTAVTFWITHTLLVRLRSVLTSVPHLRFDFPRLAHLHVTTFTTTLHYTIYLLRSTRCTQLCVHLRSTLPLPRLHSLPAVPVAVRCSSPLYRLLLPPRCRTLYTPAVLPFVTYLLSLYHGLRILRSTVLPAVTLLRFAPATPLDSAVTFRLVGLPYAPAPAVRAPAFSSLRSRTLHTDSYTHTFAARLRCGCVTHLLLPGCAYARLVRSRCWLHFALRLRFAHVTVCGSCTTRTPRYIACRSRSFILYRSGYVRFTMLVTYITLHTGLPDSTLSAVWLSSRLLLTGYRLVPAFCTLPAVVTGYTVYLWLPRLRTRLRFVPVAVCCHHTTHAVTVLYFACGYRGLIRLRLHARYWLRLRLPVRGSALRTTRWCARCLRIPPLPRFTRGSG